MLLISCFQNIQFSVCAVHMKDSGLYCLKILNQTVYQFAAWKRNFVHVGVFYSCKLEVICLQLLKFYR